MGVRQNQFEHKGMVLEHHWDFSSPRALQFAWVKERLEPQSFGSSGVEDPSPAPKKFYVSGEAEIILRVQILLVLGEVKHVRTSLSELSQLSWRPKAEMLTKAKTNQTKNPNKQKPTRNTKPEQQNNKKLKNPEQTPNNKTKQKSRLSKY